MTPKREKEHVPTCFISYSWDSKEHREWVRSLADLLLYNGVAASLDQWEVSPGTDFVHFMEERIRLSDYVVLVCTPGFREKSNQRSGGVGYEGTIVTAELFDRGPAQRKFVPVLRSGTPADALPAYLKSRAYLDFRAPDSLEKSLGDLLRHIFDEPRFRKPPLGRRPDFSPPGANRGPREATRGVRLEVTPTRPRFESNVFLNAPFHGDHRTMLRAQAFTVLECGFSPRSVLETSSDPVLRIDKILAVVSGSKYAIHDLSGSSAGARPSSNASFELGLWLAVQRFDRRARASLFIDRNRYDHRESFSDLAGFDIHEHGGLPASAVRIIRDWLADQTGATMPESERIMSRFGELTGDLPELCARLGIPVDELSFVDFTTIAGEWLQVSGTRER